MCIDSQSRKAIATRNCAIIGIIKICLTCAPDCLATKMKFKSLQYLLNSALLHMLCKSPYVRIGTHSGFVVKAFNEELQLLISHRRDDLS